MPAYYLIGFRVTPERDRELRDMAQNLGIPITRLVNELVDEALLGRKNESFRVVPPAIPK